ncbi:MAG: lipoyl synthase [Planctomycetota bacterium]|nr:lipoyl synthase [Planctomycetota bacterium]
MMEEKEKKREESPKGKPYERRPAWLRKRVRANSRAQGVEGLLEELGLSTVCDGAHCPNRPECFAKGTATFMILGERCTRNCRFCAVAHGGAGPVRVEEPLAVAAAAARLKLRHVVVTSVTRDDLPDGGAGHFAATIRAIREAVPTAVVEVLTPDFQGDMAAVETVLAAGPDVFNHNVETVPRLYAAVRPQADYRRSLAVLTGAREIARRRGVRLYTKSGLMVGLGESLEEIAQVLADLRAAGCDIVTIGQYLAPSKDHYPVARFVEPTEFDALAAQAKALGFAAVAAGPFVRSSYQAEAVFPGKR